MLGQCVKCFINFLHFYALNVISEVEYAKNLARITNSMQNSFAGEDYLPLQSVFCAALNQVGKGGCVCICACVITYVHNPRHAHAQACTYSFFN